MAVQIAAGFRRDGYRSAYHRARPLLTLWESIFILAFHLLKYLPLNSVACQLPLVGWLPIMDTGEHPAMLRLVDLLLLSN
jgi:hypothetical protein